MSTTSASAPAPTAGPNTNTTARGHRPRRGPRRGGRGGATTAIIATTGNTVGAESGSESRPQGSEGSGLNNTTATHISTHTGRGGRGGRNVIPQRQSQVDGLTNSNHNMQSSQNHNIRGGQGRRGVGRGRGRGGANGPLMVDGRRAFGGQLTTPADASSALDADAAEFVPGQPIAPRARAQTATNTPRARRMSKSQAPDIATRTHEDIANGQYECVICTNEVLPNSKIWTCKTCWTVVHLSCVKKWSKNEVSTMQQRASENGEIPPQRRWRCPGCNLPKDDLPNTSTCWCEKETDPHPIAGLPPHSCGQTCSKGRAGRCPHPCDLMCHAGPCPPCSHMGPSLACFCGKEAAVRRCLDTNYDSGWSCRQICGDLLPCGEHACQRSCHEGLCGSCEVLVESRCYCGKEEKALPCSERSDEKESKSKDESWTGSFDCGTECLRPFDCGKPGHYCLKTCHTQDAQPQHCPLSPDMVSHCPCGRTPLGLLIEVAREDCEAPVPRCKQKCLKVLECSHLCQKICHEGDCGYCLEKISVPCQCGRTTSQTICDQGSGERPSCFRVCRATLNCGRHECGERCCPGEKKASERQAVKRKHRALTAPPGPSQEEIEAEHICLKTCGRRLKCGNHFCAQLCHKGPCSNCIEAVFEEISCTCGRTVLYPPQPCGSRPPECRYDCTQERVCGHPQVKHQCHEDTEACPKCPFLMEKPCCCGKRNLKNQPCWFTEVKCGIPCGKRLKCGIHFCQQLCHRPGRCEDATTPCVQLCGRKKTVCEHTCADPCHAPYPCKEAAPCSAKTFITCECQNQKQAVKCLASKTSEGNTNKTLECNDECLRLQRNAKLAAALNLDPATHVDDHIPYSQQTLDMFRDSVKFSQTYEREFRVFAGSDKEKRLRFKPMPASQRAFIHSLAEDFGLDSESQDPEPHRHVVIFKTPRFVSAPTKTLAQCLKISTAPDVSQTTTAKPLVTTAEPFNAYVLSDAKFGLTIDELKEVIGSDFAGANLGLDISFLPSSDVVLQALSAAIPGSTTSDWRVQGNPRKALETTLVALRPTLSRKITAQQLAGELALCAVDANHNVLRREDGAGGAGAGAGGWNQVAKGGGSRGLVAVKPSAPGVGGGFAVLGKARGGGDRKEKEKKREEAVDDWEVEVEAWGGE